MFEVTFHVTPCHEGKWKEKKRVVLRWPGALVDTHTHALISTHIQYLTLSHMHTDACFGAAAFGGYSWIRFLRRSGSDPPGSGWPASADAAH